MAQPQDWKGRTDAAPPADAGERITEILANTLNSEYGSLAGGVQDIAMHLHDSLQPRPAAIRGTRDAAGADGFSIA